MYDQLIVGAGIFGICTAIELRKRKYKVAVLNPDKIPHPLAASTDISKIIRMEYGTDTEYLEMAEMSMETWRDWNELFNEKIYHETGFILATSKPMNKKERPFEYASYQNLIDKNYIPEKLNSEKYKKYFPAFNPDFFTDGFFHKKAGYAESGRAVELLTRYARQLGVEIFAGQTVKKIIIEKNKAEGVRSREGKTFLAGNTIVCAGNFTPYLIPELIKYMDITGHPVFHLIPKNPALFTPSNFAVFAADIANTGWYGFPLHPKKKVVKIANHGEGKLLHPAKHQRVVYKYDEINLRKFLRKALPALVDAPIVYTRRCCYTDTRDNHFWIDRHPRIKGLTIGTGGSGHGFKMGPVVGKMIACVAEGISHQWSDRYRWRDLGPGTRQAEEARCKKKG